MTRAPARHPLSSIILIAILSVICGADTWVDIELFGQRKRPWLATFLDLPHGIPSHDTFGRVFAVLDAEQFEACFLRWVQAVATVLEGLVVALDGKTIRGSHNRASGVPPLHLVSAFTQANRLVLGQMAVDHKSNEITALPALLQQLMLAGCIVTLERAPYGWGCQKDIAQTIRDQDADYVLGLKDNQPTLHDAVAKMFAYEQAEDFVQCPHTYHPTVNKGHGRMETRQCAG